MSLADATGGGREVTVRFPGQWGAFDWVWIKFPYFGKYWDGFFIKPVSDG